MGTKHGYIAMRPESLLLFTQKAGGIAADGNLQYNLAIAIRGVSADSIHRRGLPVVLVHEEYSATSDIVGRVFRIAMVRP